MDYRELDNHLHSRGVKPGCAACGDVSPKAVLPRDMILLGRHGPMGYSVAGTLCENCGFLGLYALSVVNAKSAKDTRAGA